MSRAKRKLQPPPDSLTSLEFVEGMARIRGYEAFRHDDTAQICWHCAGERVCCCVGCQEDAPTNLKVQAEKIRFGIVISNGEPVMAMCQACKGSGLLTWLKEVA